MFTGIITDIGTIRSREDRGDTRLVIGTAYDTGTDRPRRLDRLFGRLPDGRRQGRVRRPQRPRGLVRDRRERRDARADRAAGCGTPGRRLNLERALKIGDELGGHIVTGHVDDGRTHRRLSNPPATA
jgi:riboflavin synthase